MDNENLLFKRDVREAVPYKIILSFIILIDGNIKVNGELLPVAFLKCSIYVTLCVTFGGVFTFVIELFTLGKGKL